MKKELLYNLLLRSLNESLTDEEQLQLQSALAASKELRAEKEKLLKMNAILTNQQNAYHFKPFFAGKVMETISKEYAVIQVITNSEVDFIAALLLSFQRLAIPSFALMCVMLIYVYLTADTLSLQAIMGISGVSPEDLMLLNI
ncbi:MAG: hypothetical protein R3E32_23855 [Chitinophagales bacterium]